MQQRRNEDRARAWSYVFAGSVENKLEKKRTLIFKKKTLRLTCLTPLESTEQELSSWTKSRSFINMNDLSREREREGENRGKKVQLNRAGTREEKLKQSIA